MLRQYVLLLNCFFVCCVALGVYYFLPLWKLPCLASGNRHFCSIFGTIFCGISWHRPLSFEKWFAMYVVEEWPQENACQQKLAPIFLAKFLSLFSWHFVASASFVAMYVVEEWPSSSSGLREMLANRNWHQFFWLNFLHYFLWHFVASASFVAMYVVEEWPSSSSGLRALPCQFSPTAPPCWNR